MSRTFSESPADGPASFRARQVSGQLAHHRRVIEPGIFDVLRRVEAKMAA